MSSTKTARSYGVVSAGILSTAVALLSSRLDRALFYVLASGSIFLALAFSSVPANLILRRFRPTNEPTGQPASPVAAATGRP